MLFKYISCYCLSRGRGAAARRSGIQIHLMLLFISARWRAAKCSYYSNTSHVIVYLNNHKFFKDINRIQIHLMLLFITAAQAWT